MEWSEQMKSLIFATPSGSKVGQVLSDLFPDAELLTLQEAAQAELTTDKTVVAVLPDPFLRGLQAVGRPFLRSVREGERMKAAEVLLREPVTNSRYAPWLATIRDSDATLVAAPHSAVRPSRRKLAGLTLGEPMESITMTDVSRGKSAETLEPLQSATAQFPWLEKALSNSQLDRPSVEDSLQRYYNITSRFRDETSQLIGGDLPWL